MIKDTNLTKDDIKNKKIAAIDYGEKKVGIATTDIFHISFNPIATIDNNDKLMNNLISILKQESVQICIIGFPVRTNNLESNIHQKIKIFRDELELNSGLPCYLFDETLSSKTARQNMISVGIPPKKRQVKRNLDKFAAMIILKNFIEEIEG